LIAKQKPRQTVEKCGRLLGGGLRIC